MEKKNPRWGGEEKLSEWDDQRRTAKKGNPPVGTKIPLGDGNWGRSIRKKAIEVSRGQSGARGKKKAPESHGQSGSPPIKTKDEYGSLARGPKKRGRIIVPSVGKGGKNP